jgi:hypothetical protein
MHRRFEKLAEYEVNGKNPTKIDVRNLLYGTRESGGLSLVPLDDVEYTSRTYKKVEEVTDIPNDIDMISKAIIEAKSQKKFKSSVDFINEVEKKYRVVWKHNGKQGATATLAARNATEGSQDTKYEHQMLLVQAKTARVDLEAMREGFDWVNKNTQFNMSADDIEKMYGRAVAQDEKVLTSLSPYVRVIRYLNDESKQLFINQLAAENNVTTTTIERAIKSLSSLKVENIDYLPTPYLSQELLGVLSKWRTVTQFTGDRKNLDPQWIVKLATRHKY